MPRFTKPKDLERHLKAALDSLHAEVITTVQSELGSAAVSPYDTGRFRSSWFAAESQSSNEVAPEGANSPNTDAMGLKVDASKRYHLTNNLPYAQSVAIEGNVVSQPRTWFSSFRNQRIPKIQEAATKVIRQRFDLD
jgi:hypothetical protein